MQKKKEVEKAEVLAHEHVNWFLNVLRPLLVDHFIHGYKHGQNQEIKRCSCK